MLVDTGQFVLTVIASGYTTGNAVQPDSISHLTGDSDTGCKYWNLRRKIWTAE
jgi:hypothetical protein